MTVAKIGRSIKKCESIARRTSYVTWPRRRAWISAGAALRRRADRAGLFRGHRLRLRLDFYARVNLLNDPTATRSSGFRPSVMTRKPSACRAPVENVRLFNQILGDDINKLQTLIRTDRPIDDQQRRMRLTDGQADPHEHSRRKQTRAVGRPRILEPARMEMLPVLGFTWLLTKSIVPWCW